MNKSFVTLEHLVAKGVIAPPKGAGYHLEKFIQRLGMTKSAAAEKSGVSPSTLTRVINGQSEFTVDLAKKLQAGINAPVGLLFKMDAAAKTYEVTHMQVTA